MNTLSKLEILEETVKYYSEDTNRRALDIDSSCLYNTEDGRYCAVGRCFNEEYKSTAEKLYSGKLVEHIPNLEYKLEPQYKGHEIEFWTKLQRLHDDDDNWDENGLSTDGEAKVNHIKEIFNITE